MNWIKIDEVFQKLAGSGLPILAVIRVFNWISLEFAMIGSMIILLIAWFVSMQSGKILKRRIKEMQRSKL